MAQHNESVFSRLSRHSPLRDSDLLAWNVDNGNTIRKLLRKGIEIRNLQKKYLSLCHTSRPSVRPSKDLAQGLGAGEIVWDLTTSEKQDTLVIAALLMTKEAHEELHSIAISADSSGSRPASKRDSLSGRLARKATGASRSSRVLRTLERDPDGQMEIVTALCKALPSLSALRTLELEGLRRAFDKSGAGASRLARGLKENSSLKSFAMRSVQLSESRAQAALSAALACHPSIVTLSLEHCGLVGEAGGRLISSVIRAHAARREEMVWSAGLRKPSGLVGHTTAAAPGRIVTAGCLMVDVSGNRLGDVGVHVVARGLQSDTWLVGLNLSNNGVTDRGATLLSLCLQHNSTLCALVLDGNPAISSEAEHRIDRELETRSSMPETVLDEPEVASVLEGWGFIPHTPPSDEGSAREPSGSAPLPPSGTIKAIGSEMEMSEISENESVLMDEDGRDVSAAKPGRTCASHTQPNSGAVPATQESPRDTDEDTIGSRTRRAGIEPTATLTLYEAIPTVPIEAADDAAGTRTRSRSLSSRSPFPSAEVDVCSTRRSRSSGPLGRERCSTAGDRTREKASASGSMAKRRRRRREPDVSAGRVPWGAGPRVPGARARAHAWAHSQLSSSGNGVGVAHRGSRKAGGYCSGHHSCSGRSEHSSGRSLRHLALTSRVGNQGLHGTRTRRGKARKAWGEGSGEVDKTPWSSGISGTRATEYPARTAELDKPTRERDLPTEDEREPSPAPHPAFSLVESGEPNSESRGGDDAVAPAAPEEVHHGPGSSLGEDAAPRREERREADSTTSPDTAPHADRTARVVRLLAALEEAVAVVCQDMWRLEDRVEDSVALANRLSHQQKQQQQTQAAGTTKAASERGEARPREVGHAAVQVSSAGGGDPVQDEEDLHAPPGEGISEITTQVEARLREMWRSMPSDARGGSDRDTIARERVTSSGGRKTSEFDEDLVARRNREVDQSAIPPDPRGLPRTELVGDFERGERLREEPLQSTATDATGTAQSEEEGDAEEEGEPAKGSSDDSQPRQGAGGGGGGAEAERPVPAGIGGEGWGGVLQDGDGVEFEAEGTRERRKGWQGHGEKLHEDAAWIPDKMICARDDDGDLCVQGCIKLSSSRLETEVPEAAGTASTAAATILFPAISPQDPSEGVATLGRVILEGAEGGDKYSSDEFDDEEHDEFESYDSVRFRQILA